MAGGTSDLNWTFSKDRKSLFILIQNESSDLRDLKRYQSVRELKIEFSDFSGQFSIEDVTLIPRLEKLAILNSSGISFSGIKKLKYLKELQISTGCLLDLTPLRNHPAIRKIHIEANELFGVGILKTLPKLQSVKIFGIPEDEIEHLAGVKLIYLEADFFKISGRRNVKGYFNRVFGYQTELECKKERFIRRFQNRVSLFCDFFVRHAKWMVPFSIVSTMLIAFLALVLGQ